MIQTSYTVPYVRLAQAASEIKNQLMDAVETVLDSGQYVLGPQVSAFEEEFANRCQVKYATGVASGTCSLHLVLRGIGIAEGDEVITVPNSLSRVPKDRGQGPLPYPTASPKGGGEFRLQARRFPDVRAAGRGDHNAACAPACHDGADRPCG